MTNILQTPSPGFQAVRHSGDSMTVSLQLDSAREGKAFLRTNLGHAHIRRAEIIANVEHGRAILGRDWHDLPMRRIDERSFEIILPLCQVGQFEFKTFFVPADGGELVWPKGENVRVKIEPAATVSGNTIYNAFVRQFGPNRSGQAWTKAHRDAETFLNQAGYTVIPPSGTFADLRRELPVIMDQLGFRIIQLLPIHPTPVTFGRMGRYGSPFAPLDFFTVDSSLAVFDRHTTPLEQFGQLVADIHSRAGLVLIDLPADHTGWGSVMQVHHPEWFTRNEDGSFASPGAWGVIWEDLCKLNFDDKSLWMQLADVFLHWCQLGVDGFRCDAGYMIPAPVWTYITARVREQYPDTIFFLEGLGGGIHTTEELLQEAGHNWAYSEFFQQFGYQDMLDYIRFAISFSNRAGCLVNFAETHDNPRLAAKSPAWAALRVKTAALFSVAGAFGIANGVEWLATEKIHVHDANSLAWGSEPNLTSLIQTLTRLLNQHPAFQAQATLRIPNSFRGNAIGMLRYPPSDDDSSQTRPIPTTTPLLVAANPEENQPATLEWSVSDFNPGRRAVDLITNAVIPIQRKGHLATITLPPAAAFCLTATTTSKDDQETQICPRHWQDLRDRIMDYIVETKGYFDLADIDIDGLTRTLYEDPQRFVRQALPESSYLPIIEWRPNQDEHRVVMVPPQHLILIRHVHPFIATILQGATCQQRKRSLPQADGSSIILFSPLPAPAETPAEATLVIHVFANQPDGQQQQTENLFHRGTLSLLPETIEPVVNLSLPAEQITPEHVGLCSDQQGGFTLARAAWGLLRSKYDALFAPNLDPLVPVDRTVLLTRVRAWMIYRDYRQELNLDCQTSFAAGYANRLAWHFNVPSGMGQHVILRVEWQLSSDRRQASLTFARLLSPDPHYRHTLPDDTPVALYLRPDLDDRPNHQVTKAFKGPEQTFPTAVTALNDGFRFQPSPGHGLTMHISKGSFHESPEWHYQHPLPVDAERGLETDTDIFCPGYFKCTLLGGRQTTVAVAVVDEDAATAAPIIPAPTMPDKLPLREALRQSLAAFVVRRDQGKTVLAGFPWFLDWGRDTLICMRGLIAAGMIDDCRDIIQQFASFADKGTIPNMIRGLDHSNRDTSDAPLWLFVATSDLVNHPQGGDAILDLPCPIRPLRMVLNDIADYYWHGAANGIRADHDSALVYSPAHFTWMDTNFPAATPRAGYPVEIQALWIFALDFLTAHGGNPIYAERASLARRSLEQYFRRPDGRGLADCLHTPTPDTPARLATPDDACRPNQLLAVTLGAVTDPKLVRSIIAATRPLLTPAGIRSLDDAPVNHPIPVSSRGRPLNDPYRPYWGVYSGDEDTQRKPAYHNGTSWAWMMPSFCEALVMTYGRTAIPAAKAWLAAAAPQMQRQCIGYLPEIYDGNAPHEPKGCSAQAWSMTEFFRIYQKLTT